MISTTLSGESVFLMTEGPDWVSPVSVRFEVPVVRERGLTGRETRRPLAQTLRVASMRWNAVLRQSVVNSFRDTVGALRDERVVVPFWPLLKTGSSWASSNVSGGRLIAWNRGFTSYSIGASIASPSSWDYVAPAILCRIASVRPELADPQTAVLGIEVEEDALETESLAPSEQTWAIGAALDDGTTPVLFPFRVNWETRPNVLHGDVERSAKLFGRHPRQASALYPQNSERSVQASVTLQGANVGKLLRWWQDRQGSTGAHYLGGMAEPTGLASDAAAGASSVTLASGPAVGAYRLFGLRSGTRETVIRAASIAGNVATLTGTMAQAWTAAGTSLTLALLARHASDGLDLSFREPWLAEGKLSWSELAAEYVPGAGETRAVTIGALSTRAFLYEFTLDWNGTTEPHRFTSFGRDVTASSQTWTAVPIEHTEIRQTIRMDREEIRVKGRWTAGGPLRVFMPGALDAVVRLSVFECVVTAGAGSSVVQVFGGEVTGVRFDGPFFDLGASGDSALFDRRAPRMLIQPGCNHAVFDAGCGLVAAGWVFEALAVSGSGASVTLGTFDVPAAADAAGWGFADFFALGYLERTVGGKPRRHTILRSTAKTGGGQVTFTLRTPLESVPTVGEEFRIVPGCDGRPETCRAYNASTNPTGVFNNFTRFGGFPAVPDKNPAFTAPKKSTSTSGKK